MSDPVTNVEIEDVLSSIRRLVSGDDRAARASDSTPEPGNAQAQTSQARTSQAQTSAPDRLVLTPSLRIDPDAQAGGAPKRGTEMRRDGDTERPEADDEKSRLLARVAELEEVVARQSDIWDPDGAPGNENSARPVAPLPWEDDLPQDGDDDAADMPDTEDAGTSGSEGTSRADTPQRDEDLHAGRGGGLDEDALRDLVANIVREELQGALGERITRNVRKLVRREIHRILASQDLK